MSNTSRSFFEEQRANHARTTIFFAFTSATIIGLGLWTVFLQTVLLAKMAALFSVYPMWAGSESPVSWSVAGAFVGFFLWLTCAVALHFRSSTVLPRLVGARQATGADKSCLERLEKKILVASGNPGVEIELYVWESTILNAFASGRSLENGSITITRGVLTDCSDEEVEAILAHETAHLYNRDAIRVSKHCARHMPLLPRRTSARHSLWQWSQLSRALSP